ncbi:MAG: O-antigen ligase family protein [Bacteroidia bacterium]|nr:O-antigen ligase family protein [Bacteroidia bacterium]
MQNEFAETLVYLVSIVLGGAALVILPLYPRASWVLLGLGIPWASEIAEIGSTLLTLPTDAFAVMGGVAVVMYLLFAPNRLLDIRRNPILRWVIAYLAWMGITIAFSSNPIISAKFWLSQTAYFTAFGLGGYLWLRSNSNNLPQLFLAILLSASIVLSFCVFKHFELGGERETVDKAISPFMREHTVYGAYSAWFFTMSVALVFLRPNLFTIACTGITATALLLSYSRGAWLTALGALSLWAVIEILRHLLPTVRFFIGTVGGFVVLIAGLFLIGYNPDILQLRARQQFGEMGEHLASSFDVKKNPSNMERINRWFSALQMVEERPIWGFGANTFIREYSAYQRSLKRTSISVEMGEVGGAHSEYLTAASELGIPGLILLLGIYLSTIQTGLGGMWRSTSTSQRRIYAALTLPLISYYLHGFINNFMDHGHMAALLYLHWSALAALRQEAVPSLHAASERA